jgi:hypothetical protein
MVLSLGLWIWKTNPLGSARMLRDPIETDRHCLAFFGTRLLSDHWLQMPTSNGLSDIRVSSKWLFRLLQLTWIVFKRLAPPRNQWTYNIVSAAGPLANSWSLRWQRGDPFFCLVISSSRLDGPHPVFDGWKITRRVSMCPWGCPQMVSWVSCYTWMFFSGFFSQHTK